MAPGPSSGSSSISEIMEPALKKTPEMVPAPAMTCTNCPRPSSRHVLQKWALDSALERDCEISSSSEGLYKELWKGLQNML